MTHDMQDHRMELAKTPVWRRALEVLLGSVIFKRHLPPEDGGGALVVSGNVGGMKYVFKRSRQWDPKLLKIAALLIRDGAAVWDVGANVGLFSRAAAFHAGERGAVFAIEADGDAVALLHRTRRHRPAGHADIAVLPVAVSSARGFVRFDIARRARAANAIGGFGTTQTGGIAESRTLPCVTLDSMLDHFRAPDVLKIDVEGAELEVLRGAQRVIESVRPAIYCEIQSSTWFEASSLLERAGYELRDGDHVDGALGGPAVSATTCNLLAIPKEKFDRILLQHG